MSKSRFPVPPTRWMLRAETGGEANAAAVLERSLRLPPAICRLLVVRGFAEEAAAKAFLRPKLDELGDASQLAGVEQAVVRLTHALDTGQRILVHGDYDADGICTTVLLTRVLRELGGRVEPFVPCRIRHGYDLGPAGVQAAKDVGAALIVTGDCGIVAHDAIEMAAAAGIDVIVTDHHTPAETLPPAVAVINPRRPDCPYPEKMLAGAGVAFKLCQALAAARGLPQEWAWQYLDLVALATVADMMPLAGENRLLVRWGLQRLTGTANIGLRALIRRSKLNEMAQLTAVQVSHVLAPRLNAAGRLGDAGRAVRLLLTDSAAEADSLAGELEDANRQRQDLDRSTLGEALALLEAECEPERDFGIVLASASWNPGIIGIVASRVVERIQRPVLLVALRPGGSPSRGSGRSIPHFHLYDALKACSSHLERFGGHKHAAGLDIRRERLPAFRAAFNEYARAALQPEHMESRIVIDLELRLAQADGELLRYFKHFAPFGLGNPAPVLATRGVTVKRRRNVGDGHVQLRLAQGGAELQAIGFRMADRLNGLACGASVDVAYQLQEDHWRNRTRLQAKLLDVRPSARAGG